MGCKGSVNEQKHLGGDGSKTKNPRSGSSSMTQSFKGRGID